MLRASDPIEALAHACWAVTHSVGSGSGSASSPHLQPDPCPAACTATLVGECRRPGDAGGGPRPRPTCADFWGDRFDVLNPIDGFKTASQEIHSCRQGYGRGLCTRQPAPRIRRRGWIHSIVGVESRYRARRVESALRLGDGRRLFRRWQQILSLGGEGSLKCWDAAHPGTVLWSLELPCGRWVSPRLIARVTRCWCKAQICFDLSAYL